jgi:hypothetical protein
MPACSMGFGPFPARTAGSWPVGWDLALSRPDPGQDPALSPPERPGILADWPGSGPSQTRMAGFRPF